MFWGDWIRIVTRTTGFHRLIRASSAGAKYGYGGGDIARRQGAVCRCGDRPRELPCRLPEPAESARQEPTHKTLGHGAFSEAVLIAHRSGSYTRYPARAPQIQQQADPTESWFPGGLGHDSLG